MLQETQGDIRPGDDLFLECAFGDLVATGGSGVGGAIANPGMPGDVFWSFFTRHIDLV